MLKFGTDGFRGKFGKDLTEDIAYKIGNALNGEILIGRDTRASGKLLSDSFIQGATTAGANVCDVGICPTAGIAYLTKLLDFDYGVVITASHNPYEYNGIKVFNSNGLKLNKKQEEQIEQHLNTNIHRIVEKKGSYAYKNEYVNDYIDFLKNNTDTNFTGIRIALDCANGASYSIAPQVFSSLGATVIPINCEPNGQNINERCGSTDIRNLQKEVVTKHADIGFAFDGDSDRLIAVDELGSVVNGDKILYMLATYYKELGKLDDKATVVGTLMTNIGIEKALNKNGINLIRTNVGDKYVSEELENNKLLLGAEQSGHILIKDKFSTGDGILSAIMVADICKKKDKTLSSFFNIPTYAQISINVETPYKDAVFNSKELEKVINEQNDLLVDSGRILVRKSGTEPVIRIMVESQNSMVNYVIAQKIQQVILKVNNKLQQEHSTEYISHN